MNKKQIAGYRAAEYVKDNIILGLGTGSTAFYMIEKVGEMVQEGLRIKAVATSDHSAMLAKERGIPLLSFDEIEEIDLIIDGVDEIDPEFNAIKGGGGALFREKMVAMAAKEIIWIMDDSKLVESLGAFPLPIELLPFGYKSVLRKLEEHGYNPMLRRKEGQKYQTDNGNYIADLSLGKNFAIEKVNRTLKAITGVLETGLFLNLCNRIVVGTENGVRIIENDSKQKE